jgi:antirestriction protein ArdC
MAAPDTRRRTANGKIDTRVNEALERLESGVSRILDGEEFKRYLSVAARFHHYSPNNCLLILMQRPDATRVAGYRAWQQLGRQVRKGEKGIRILAPISRKVAEDEETGEVVRALVGFKTATVFDVSQTDGEPLTEAPRPEDLDSEEGAEIAGKVYEGLSRFCQAEGVAVEFEKRRSGEYGTYQRRERRITLNATLPATEKATTLAHELAHHLLHARADGTAKQTREIEAEGAAFVVCAAFGLDTSRFTFAYVANYASEPEALKAALERIQGAARRLIEAVEDSMDSGRS